MRYCPNCGQQVQEGIAFCPNCGSQMNGQGNQGYNQGPMKVPGLRKNEIVIAILLSIITCGIYGIIWYCRLADDTNKICNDNGPSGIAAFLLTIITCGIYGLIFFYNLGKRLAAAGPRYGIKVDDNSILYIILALLGLGIVNYCLVQSDINKFAA